MKRICFVIITALILFFCFCGCGQTTESVTESEKYMYKAEVDGHTFEATTQEDLNQMVNTYVLSIDGDTVETEKERTTNSLKPYLAIMGQDTSDDYGIDVTDEFIYGAESVYVMGRTGTVTHGTVEDYPTQIRLMYWTDNEKSIEAELEEFAEVLSDYFGLSGLEENYDNVSDHTYVWQDHSTGCYVLCWYEDDHIMMRWDYNEKVTITPYYEETNETPQLTRKCEVDGCEKEAEYSMVGFSGKTEYYCYTHYKELQDNMEKITGGSITTSSSTTSSSWKEVTDAGERNICWSLSCEAVKSQLKSPSSADFPFSYSSSDVSITASGNTYKVKSIVDADNSFGTKIRSNTTVVIEKSGSNFTVTSCTIS